MDVLETTDVERAFWAYDRASVSNIVVQVGLKGVGVDRASLLEVALLSVVGRHPYLNHTFSSDGKFLIRSDRPRVGWREWDASTGPDVSALVHQELHEPFDLASLPLVRAHLVRQARDAALVVVTLAHPVSDAVGAYHLVREVLDEWDGAVSGNPVPHGPDYRFRRPRTADFPEARTHEPLTLRCGSGADHLSTDTPGAVGGDVGTGESASRGSRVVSRTLDAASTASLRNRARRWGVSVNSLVTATLLAPLAQSSPSGAESTTIQIGTAVNLRPLLAALSLTSHDLGMWAGRFHLLAHVGPQSQVLGWARGFQDAVETMKPRAFDALRSLSSPRGDGKLLKMTHHGNLDRDGLSAPLRCATITEFRGYTPLHRGVRPGNGLGLIASVFHDRLDLSFVFAEELSPGSWSDDLVRVVLRDLSAE